MSNVIGLSKYHEDNLRKLAAYLLSGELKAKFDMTYFTEYHSILENVSTECGTVGCAAGHGPHAGIPKLASETWSEYIERQFGIGLEGYNYSWCFQGDWSRLDNTPEGAGKRILWLLDKGIPENARDQCNKRVPLCYL